MKPERFQYRPLSKPITLLHSAWWTLGPVEFSVWHSPQSRAVTERAHKFRMRLHVGRFLMVFDWQGFRLPPEKEDCA